MKWFIKVFRHYADFSGRARRSEFWYFVLFNFIATVVAMIIDRIGGWELTVDSRGIPNCGPCYLSYAAAVFLPALAVTVRRLHDLGKNAWWILISLIPVAGAIWLAVLFCADGQNGLNHYGANPKSVKQFFPERRREKSIAAAFIVGAAATLLLMLMQNWIARMFDPLVPFWLISALPVVLMLLFGVFYLPVADSVKTAKRQNIAFVLLAIAALIPALRGILVLVENHIMPGFLYLANNIVALLLNLALAALALLLLFKSEQKNIRLVSALIIIFSMLGIVILFVALLMFFPVNTFAIILKIAIILLAVHYLYGKSKAKEDELSPEPDERPSIKNSSSYNQNCPNIEK